MKFGLTDNEYEYLKETVVFPLQGLGCAVWCYGSRARGDHSKYSDVDMMVEAPKTIDESKVQKQIFEISETLSKSNFPYIVDLVLYSNFAESYKKKYLEEKKFF
ncbi:MAG: nucleotidyltransferase domain-containing protein [Bdellovibrionales bacterium]|nr:nucleotidyltransferase domain-containing protein [Bdellovibrionales bacterium]